MQNTPELLRRLLSRPDLGEITTPPEELARFRNLYLLTDLGRLDILGETPPLGGYSELAASAVESLVAGRTCRVISIDHLIEIKSSLDRPKDRETAIELKAIRARLRAQSAS